MREALDEDDWYTVHVQNPRSFDHTKAISELYLEVTRKKEKHWD